jgi:chorismate dehydratase
MLRFGCHDFINSMPILHGLRRGGRDFALSLGKPSAVAEMLRGRKVDIAMAPAIEYLRNEDYVIVPDVCIAARGEVGSVNLYHRKPLGEVRTIAVDPSSLTSAALIRIMMEKCFKARPQYTPAKRMSLEDLPRAEADGVLLIGDEALGEPPAGYEVLDLSEQWLSMTGLPFVFAVCCARRGAELGGFGEALRASLAEGLAHIPEIAAEAARKYGLPKARVEAYLSRNLRYTLGAEERQGLKRFFAEVVAAGLWPKERELEFHGG